MSILTSKLPVTVTINNAEVPINWDFRISLEFAELMEQSGDEDIIGIIEKALKLYYPTFDSIEDINTAIEQMLWFYRCGKPEIKEGKNKRVLSFEHDAGYIAAAFLEQYSIDFQSVGELHWWKFKTLFEGLKEDTEIVKIIGYRSMDLGKLDKDQKAFYKKMKKLYKLPGDEVSKKEQELLNKIDSTLQAGGDVTVLLTELNKE